MKAVTIADVAAHAKVSKSTVSQYLNKRYDRMREDTKLRVEEAIKELGYRPNIVARSLKQKSTSTIGVIVANILHNFSTQVIRAIEDVCNETGFHIIVCNADDDPEKEKKYIEMLQAKQVDGLIILPTGNNVELYKQMVKDRYPIVFVDRLVHDLPITSVLLDNEKAARLAVQHLIDNGYDRIGIVTNVVRNVTPRMERIKGYKKTLEENGIPVDEDLIKSMDVNGIQAALAGMFTTESAPNAILATNDLTLIEVLKYVKNNQMNIPQDLAVVGIDEVSFAGIYEPAITTVAQPTFEMGKAAAEHLLNKIQHKEEEEEAKVLRFEPRLIVRKSTVRGLRI